MIDTESRPSRQLLRTFVVSAYDLQMLRMQTGLRLCANFRHKLKPTAEEAKPENGEELSEEAQILIKTLTNSYRRLTDGIARNRTLPAEKGFTGDELITSYAELVLVHAYVSIEKNEVQQFAQFKSILNQFPVYTEYLEKQVGIGPAMAGVLLAYFDINVPRISNFWSYAGLDVAKDGRGRSRRAEHLVAREYVDRNGDTKTRQSLTHEPWLKSKLVGVLATSFLRMNSPWREQYDNYKNRIMTDPNRQKVTLVEYKKLHKVDPEAATKVWPPLRVHRAALRYMVKMFLADFWLNWRKIEGLPVTGTYHEEVLGHKHGGVPTGQGASGLAA